MSTNNEASSPTKRSSLSSRASKIPQKIAQSTFFALRPSSSTLTTSSVVTNSDSISTRLSQMFRPRTASETVFKDTSIQEIDNRIQHLSLSKSPTFHTSSSIDIQKGQQTKKCSQSHELPQKHSKIDTYTNTYTQSNISSPSPYSTSSPERTDFYSYHHNITPNNEFSSNGFSPLSLTNSTISLADSLINSQLTISTSLMPSNSKDASSFEGLVADTTKELATAILDYTSYLLDLFNTTDDFAFAHLRELDSIVIRSASANRLALNKPSSAPPQKDAKKAQRPRSVNEKASSRGLSNGGSSRLLQEAILDEQKRNKITEPEEEIPPVPNISRSTLLQDFRKGIASSSRRIKGAASDDLFNRRQSQLRSPDKSSQNQSITKTDTEEGKSKEKVNNNLAKKENKNDKASISESVRKENSTTVSSIKNNTTPKPNAPVRPSQLLLSVASKSTNVANLKNSPSAAVSWR
ncbi:hypothetical protein A0J61_06269 [Choanephora cucurbitarum]|uniref:Uncharacterized protein n=1 Tax=Choanephora cucurbitarum TaxID=101091 RepID=A0A1C7N974_9FUNG|nr:hypothetical protein A0J61_06269 [Choanephora cucurbitarum]